MEATCVVCFGEYDAADSNLQPRGLPCGHTICTGCLGLILEQRGSSRSCPLCKRELTATVLSSYPRNYALEEILESLRRRSAPEPQESELNPADLQLTNQVIGTGGSGAVWAGVLQLGPVALQVAVKMLATPGSTVVQMQRFKREIKDTYTAARACPQVCRTFGSCMKEQQLCLVMLRYTGSLTALVQGGALTAENALKAALQVAKGVQQLHALNILHLDINPQNVLVDEHGDCFVSDFGIAQQMQQAMQDYNPSVDLNGTPNFTSPEAVLRGSTPVSFAADVWSLAATITFMFSGTMPYQGYNLMQLIDALTVTKRAPEVPSTVPDVLHPTLHSCFSFVPAQRPSINQLVEVLKMVRVCSTKGRLAGRKAQKKQTQAPTEQPVAPAQASPPSLASRLTSALQLRHRPTTEHSHAAPAQRYKAWWEVAAEQGPRSQPAESKSSDEQHQNLQSGGGRYETWWECARRHGPRPQSATTHQVQNARSASRPQSASAYHAWWERDS